MRLEPMLRLLSPRVPLLATTFAATLGLAASCSVDMSGLTFEDLTTHSPPEGGATGDEEDPGCEHATLRCAERQVQVCAGGDWYDAGAPCEFACVAGLCVGSCRPGDSQCASSISTQLCGDTGSWTPTEECEFSCVAGVCDGECRPGSMGCDAAMPKRCDDTGTWQDERERPCTGGCADGACTGACSSEEDPPQCSDLYHVQTCTDGQWGAPVECENNVCLMGQCVGDCRPGDTRCDSPTQVSTCGHGGAWGSPTDCGDRACVAGICTGSCRPGTRRCDEQGTGVEECNDNGQWRPLETCDEERPLCAPVKGVPACVACYPHARRCTLNRIEVCTEEGSWSMDSSCRGDTICHLGTCYEEKKVCEEHPTARGCLSNTVAWNCDRNGFGTTPCLALERCVDGTCELGLPLPLPLSLSSSPSRARP